MKYLFSKEGAKQLGGFGTIGSIFPATWDWYQFWYMTAFLSIILAFMNILPIPALDGGHVLFLIYEIVARRKPSDKFMERAQMVGMFLLFGLLIWANFKIYSGSSSDNKIQKNTSSVMVKQMMCSVLTDGAFHINVSSVFLYSYTKCAIHSSRSPGRRSITGISTIV